MLLSNGTASDPRLDIYADDNVTRDAAVTAPVHGAKTPATLAPGLAIVILTLDRADLMLPPRQLWTPHARASMTTVR